MKLLACLVNYCKTEINTIELKLTEIHSDMYFDYSYYVSKSN